MSLESLYSQKKELLEKKEKYLNALSITSNISEKIFHEGKALDEIKGNLQSSFTISGMTADGGKIEMLISSLGEVSQFFSGNLSSQIDTELTKLGRQIDNCQSQIDQEIARQRAEEAKQKEENTKSDGE